MSMINNKDDQQEVIIKESSENIPNESSGLYYYFMIDIIVNFLTKCNKHIQFIQWMLCIYKYTL